MGLVNNRAFCPSCGGKIHTRARGLAGVLPFRGGILVWTGTRCQHCGEALSGKVGVDNVAIPAGAVEAKRQARQERGEPTADDVARQRVIHQQAHDRYQAKAAKAGVAAELDRRLLDLLAAGPVAFADAVDRLGTSTMELARAQTRLKQKVTASGLGKKRTLKLR